MKAPETFGQALMIGIELLDPNPWNPNVMDAETFRKEKNSIVRFGFVVPVVVRASAGGRYQIIDGEHRVRAARELGMREVPIYNIGPISDHEAQQLTVILNELHGDPEPDKLGELLRGLLASDTLDELVEVMPFTKDQFGTIAKLPEFDWEQFKDKTANGNGGDRWRERIFRMPNDAAVVLDKALGMARADDHADLKDWQALEKIAAAYLGHDRG